jgi:8-oxo-dGTP pyrophosphatase MutT (NUDIX family)
MSEPAIFSVERLDLTFAPKPWGFALERRAEIEAFFAALRREKPEIWNGRVLLLHSHAVRDGVFSGEYLETDFAGFSAWTAWGRPPAGVYDCFGAAALKACDGAFLLGVMAPHTFTAGQVYFPCGTPDPSDIIGGKVDLDFSVRRELEEETGLDAAELELAPGWTTVIEGGEIAQIKLMRSADTAEVLRARILKHIAREARAELADIHIVRGRQDFDDAMPGFVTAFLTSQFGRR